MTSPSNPGVSELLPCPFCGGPVDVEETRPASNGQRFWGVTCRNTLNVGGTCAIEQIPSGSRETAIARWNARAIPAVVVPELPTWEDGENKLRRGEKLTALEKFVMDHDWHKTDTTFRDGLEAVFAELRAIPADRVAVDREELKALQELLAQARCAAHAVEDDGECDMTGVCGAVLACDALRANQGCEK